MNWACAVLSLPPTRSFSDATPDSGVPSTSRLNVTRTWMKSPVPWNPGNDPIAVGSVSMSMSVIAALADPLTRILTESVLVAQLPESSYVESLAMLQSSWPAASSPLPVVLRSLTFSLWFVGWLYLTTTK